MTRPRLPSERSDAERIVLERIATRRALTAAEDARLAELAFVTHHRGYSRAFDARRIAPISRRATGQ